MTRTDPDRRPTSAEETLALIDRRPAAVEQPTRRFATLERPPAHELAAPERRRWGRVLAAVAVLAVLAGAFLLLDGDSGKKQSREADSAFAARERDQSEAAGDDRAATLAAVPEPAGDDPALGSSLNQEGFELIGAGDYEGAVPVLEDAVRAFPPGTEDLNYAYALFNLGKALRLSGRPDEAIPVLERRLRIPNQTDVVRRELDAARGEAGL